MLITNGKLLQDIYTLQDDYALRYEGEIITEIGKSSDLIAKYPQDEIIDAQGGLIMPANICAHTHFYGAYARGMAIPPPAPKDFPEILTKLWWALDRALDRDAVRLSALVCLVDAIKHGTTTLIDHHASPAFITGSLDVIAQAVDQAGLRAVLCYEVTDRNGEDGTQEGIQENLRFLRQKHPRLAGTFGLHASLSLSEKTLRQCVEAGQAVNTGFHIHVAEHEADEYDSMNKYGKRVVQRLYDAGILGEKTIVAHAVHCDYSEIKLLQETGTWISHQPRSNMNNAVGAAPIDELLAAEMKLCLGNDGFSNNMWAEWKAAYFLHKVANRDPRRAGGDGIAKMALENNARLAEVFFPDQTLGKLQTGAAADIIIVDYYPFTPLSVGNLPWHIIFGFEASMVRTTISSGKILMQDRKLLTLDEKTIMQEALSIAPQVWERYTQLATQ